MSVTAYKYYRFPFAQAGTLAAVPDVAPGDGSVSYPTGWGPDYALDPATQPAALDMPRDKSNQLMYDATNTLKYFQEGKVPQWIAAADNGGVAFAYDFLACVLYTDGYIYQSVATANNAVPGASANWVRTRIRIGINTTFGISPTGNNANAGTVASPWLTLQFAFDSFVKNYDFGGFQVTIQAADSLVYAGGSITGLVPGQNSAIILNGNAGAPTNVLFTSSIGAGASTALQCQNFKIQNAAGDAIVSSGNIILSTGLTFGVCTGAHVYSNGGTIAVNANYAITGGATAHYQLVNLGKIIIAGGITCTLTGTPAFTVFATANIQSTLNVAATAIAYSGAATGQRYALDNLSLIAGTAAGANFFPGNSAGVNTGHGAIYN